MPIPFGGGADPNHEETTLKLEKWDPDLRTLHLRFNEGRLDLQPAFQRGLVWPLEKKARLVDSALRSWSIPPIHLIREPDGRLSVLDGQQLLAAFFDFLDDRFAIRRFQPIDHKIETLVGLTFGDLPTSEQYRILDTRIPAFEIYEYSPDEPYELFFRLNHPTGLTAAEKRNALAGTTRAQVRELVETAEAIGWSKQLIGFSDARGAYDDVIARACRYIETGRLDLRISVSVMEEFYRNPDGISRSTLRAATSSIHVLARASHNSSVGFKFNKATLLTWLLIAARAELTEVSLDAHLPKAIGFLERARLGQDITDPRHGFERLVELYRNRSSLRVGDVLSVTVRDAIAGFVVDSLRSGRSFHPASDDIAHFLVQHSKQSQEDFTLAFLDLAGSAKHWSHF